MHAKLLHTPCNIYGIRLSRVGLDGVEHVELYGAENAAVDLDVDGVAAGVDAADRDVLAESPL
jgi:hypothetical protein